MKYGFIYLTTNLLNNKNYVGQRNYKEGWEKYLGSGKWLKRSIQKHGAENFKRVILRECESLEESNFWEVFYIKLYSCTNKEFGYNILEGGKNSTRIHTEETKAKISKTLKGRIRPLEETEKATKSRLANPYKMSDKNKKIVSDTMKNNCNRKQPYKLIKIATNEELEFITSKSCCEFLGCSNSVFMRYVNGFRKGYPNSTNYQSHIYKGYKIIKLI